MTPAEQAAAEIADPAWDFERDPVSAISDAATKAAQHMTYGRAEQGRYWAEVSARLSAAAGMRPGIVVQDLVDFFGITVE